MNVDDLLSFYEEPNDRQLAKKLGKGVSTISQWRSDGIPARTQAVFQIQTKGKLKADLNRLAG